MMLRDIQNNFADAVLRQRTDMEKLKPEFLDFFSGPHIQSQERLKIYQNNVVGGIARALASKFPLLEKLVGDEFLMMLCREFAILKPPNSGCFHTYGQGFDDFIKNHRNTQSLPYLYDMTKLEFATSKAEYGDDDIALNPEEIRDMHADNLHDLKLDLRATTSLLATDYPVLKLKDFCLNPDANSPPDTSSHQRDYLLVFRPFWEVCFVPLDCDEFEFISGLNEGKTLGDATTLILNKNPNFNLGNILSKHLSLGSFKTMQKHP